MLKKSAQCATMGQYWYYSFPGGFDMAKQVHIRVEDEVYEALTGYSADKGQSMQDCISSAIKQMLVKVKDVPAHTREQYTFIDLFAGKGVDRIGNKTL